MGWVSISAVFGRVVVSRDTTCLGCSTRAGFAAPMVASLLIKKSSYCWLAPLIQQDFPSCGIHGLVGSTNMRELGLKIIAKQPLGHSVTGTLAERRLPYSLFS